MEGEWLRKCITLILLLLYRQYAHKQYFITVINRIRMESFLRVYLAQSRENKENTHKKNE